MNKIPRSLMFIYNLRPGPTGGAEIQAERLAIRLSQLGYPISILTSRPFPQALSEEEIEGVKIHRADFQLPYFVWTHGMESFRYFTRHRREYDIIHCHMAYGNAMVGVIAAKMFNKKCIIKPACGMENWSDFSVFSTFDGYEYAFEILRQADAFVAISHDVERELHVRGIAPEKIVYIPNGVDTEAFKLNEPRISNQPVHFIQVGRRHPQKGIDIILQSAKKLKESGFDDQFKITFYGHKYQEFDYVSMAHSLNVDDIVTFEDFIADSYSFYKSANAFLLPSRGEGLSNSLLEAMSMELPAIVTRISGNVDVVEDGVDGILISPDSVEELVTAMQKIIERPAWALEIGKKARRKIVNCFSMDYVANQYGKLYNNLCGFKGE